MEETKKVFSSKPKKKLLSNSESSDEYSEEKEEREEKDQNNTLYDLLNVTRTSTPEEIKKQYRLLALKLHPDKNQGTEEAKANFQKLNEAYSILSDPRKRKLYDDTGLIEDGNMDDFEAAYNFFRTMYKKVEKEDINNFEAKYKNSQEEIDDLIAFYNKNSGDVTLILQEIILSQNSDVQRFLDIYDKLISENQLQNYSKFQETRNSIKLLPDESKKLKKNNKKQQDFQKLEQQILAKYNNVNPSQFLDRLASKYDNPSSKKKKGKQQKKLDTFDEEIPSKKRNGKKKKI